MVIKKPSEVAVIVTDLVKKFNKHPIDINMGFCSFFAGQLVELLGDDASIRWGLADSEFFTPAHEPDRHCYVLYDGRYYDAEEPYGVKSPDLLPFFMRHLHHNKRIRDSIHNSVSSLFGEPVC